MTSLKGAAKAHSYMEIPKKRYGTLFAEVKAGGGYGILTRYGL